MSTPLDHVRRRALAALAFSQHSWLDKRLRRSSRVGYAGGRHVDDPATSPMSSTTTPRGDEEEDGDGTCCTHYQEIQCEQDGQQTSAPLSACFPQPGSNPGPTALDHPGESDRDESVEAHALAVRRTCQLIVERFGHPQEKPPTVRAPSATGLLVRRLSQRTR
jgi:hypothetical protein